MAKSIKLLILILIIMLNILMQACVAAGPPPIPATPTPSQPASSKPQVNTPPPVSAPPTSSMPVRGSADYIIAASNAADSIKAQADYVAPAAGWERKVQANLLAGRKVKFIGDFTISTGLTLPSDIDIDLEQATITVSDNVNADFSVFRNADITVGNTGISIHGGHLKGNESGNSLGSQYGIRFTKVTESKIDSWIEDFRTADELMVGSTVKYNNRNYDDDYTPRVVYLAHGEDVGEFSPAAYLTVSSDRMEGRRSIQFHITDNGTFKTFYTSAAFDLRFYPMVTFKSKSGQASVPGQNNIVEVVLFNARLDKSYVLSSHGYMMPYMNYYDLNHDKWILGLVDLSNIDWITLGSTPDNFLKDVKIGFKSQDTAATILFDDIYAIRGLPRAIITQAFDDGYATDYTEAAYMQKYGWNGVSTIIPRYVGSTKRFMPLDQLHLLYDAGWDISNHSYNHPQTALTEGEQRLQDAAGRAWLEENGFTRSAKYRLYTGGQSQLNNTDSEKISAARRYLGTNNVTNSSAGLPYGYTQQAQNGFGYTSSTNGTKIKVIAAKKFHMWQLVFTHNIDDTPSGTPVPVYRDFIDWLYSNGMDVKNYSQVYAAYPLEKEPVIDFTVKEYSVTYKNISAAASDCLSKGQKLNAALPVNFTLDNQPDVPRTITWNFGSHANITAFTLKIAGIDSHGLDQIEAFTEANGWSGETSRAMKEITSVQITTRKGTGVGDTLNIGVGSKLGIPNKIFAVSDVLAVKKNEADMTSGSYIVNERFDTIDMSVKGAIVTGDDFTIRYKSNLDILSIFEK